MNIMGTDCGASALRSSTRAKKLLKRLVATPMRSDYLLSLVLSRMATLSIK